MSETRMPTQKRSIEKRNKIIEKGFELICDKGYHNVTTADIAKYAGVSTGIVYQYFNDKQEIFIEGVKNYSKTIMYPMIDIFEQKNISLNNIKNIINDIIDKFIEAHTISQKAHEELMAMSHQNEEVARIFKTSELETTEKIVAMLEANNIHINNSHERVHIAYGIIDNFCHEVIYHKHEEIDYNVMKEEIVTTITALLFS